MVLRKLYDYVSLRMKITIEHNFYTHNNNILLPCRHNTDKYTNTVKNAECKLHCIKRYHCKTPSILPAWPSSHGVLVAVFFL
jgi:hypothetical protein